MLDRMVSFMGATVHVAVQFMPVLILAGLLHGEPRWPETLAWGLAFLALLVMLITGVTHPRTHRWFVTGWALTRSTSPAHSVADVLLLGVAAWAWFQGFTEIAIAQASISTLLLALRWAFRPRGTGPDAP